MKIGFSAFPHPKDDPWAKDDGRGLTQRDYIAIEAMKALIPIYEKCGHEDADRAFEALEGASIEAFVATRAFAYADALIGGSK